MKVGYARVSTEEQNLSLQINALTEAGCDKIFTDQGISGAVGVRRGLDEALSALSPGDKLVVWRLDRLGRSLFQLIQLLETLGKKGILFRSLNEHIDTSSSGGRLVFHLMGALAEFERALISERTRAGMEAARMRGQRIGRRPSLTFEQRRDAYHLIKCEQRSFEDVANQYSVHPQTLRRHLRSLDGGTSV